MSRSTVRQSSTFAGLCLDRPRSCKPGAPKNLRRGSNYLEIVWDPPSTNAEFVTHYKVQYTDANDSDDPWHSFETDKRCFNVGKLKLKSNTYYQLCVQSAKGKIRGECSAIIEMNTGKPGPPQNIHSSYREPTCVKIVWDPPSTNAEFVTHYILLYTKANDSDDPWHSLETKELFMCQDDFEPNTVYNFYVQSANGNICENDARSETFEMITTIPGPPQHIRPSSNHGSECLEIQWDPPSTNAEFVTHYIVHYMKANDSDDPWHSATVREGLTFTTENLEHNILYKLCVQSASDNTDGENSESIKIGTGKPGPPQHLRPSSNRGSTFLEILWDKPFINAQFVTHYIVRYTKANDKKDPWHSFETEHLSFKAKQLESNTVYDFYVQSANGKNAGENSATIQMGTVKPGPPENIRSSNRGSTLLEIVWDKPYTNAKFVTHYIVQYTKANDDKDPWHKLKTTKLSIKVDELENDTLYSIRVKSANGEAIGEYCEIVNMGTGTPGPPQNVRPSSNRGGTCLKVRWNPPSTNAEFVTHYRAEYTKANDLKDPWHLFKETKVPKKLSAVARNLKPDTDYLFRILSANGNIDGEYSKTVKMDTRWSKVAKVAVTPGAVIGGALASPIVGAAGAAALVWEGIDPKNPVAKAAAGVLAAAAGVFGGVAGIVAAPVGGVVAAAALHDQRCDSPQSDDD